MLDHGRRGAPGAPANLEAPQLPVNGIEVLSSDLKVRQGVSVVERPREDTAKLGQIFQPPRAMTVGRDGPIADVVETSDVLPRLVLEIRDLIQAFRRRGPAVANYIALVVQGG